MIFSCMEYITVHCTYTNPMASEGAIFPTYTTLGILILISGASTCSVLAMLEILLWCLWVPKSHIHQLVSVLISNI